MLPAFAGWLVAGGGKVVEQDIRYWGDAVRELTPATVDEAAWLDLVLLVTGNDLRALLSGRYGQPQFSQRLARAWQELAAAGPHGGAVDELAEAALTVFLERAPWRAGRAQAVAVGNLVQALTEKVSRPRLLEVVLDPVETLRQMRPGARPGEIARACARAYTEGAGLRQVADAPTQSGAITSAEQAAQMVDRVHRVLAEAGVSEESFLWPVELAARLARGVIARPHAAEFAVLVAGRYSDEIRFRIRLLDTIARSALPDASQAIDAPILEDIQGSRRELDEFLKEARKRQSRGSLAGRILGGRGSEGKPPGPGEQDTGGGRSAHGTEGIGGTGIRAGMFSVLAGAVRVETVHAEADGGWREFDAEIRRGLPQSPPLPVSWYEQAANRSQGQAVRVLDAALVRTAEHGHVAVPVNQVRDGLLEEVSVPLSWSEPFAAFPGGPLKLDSEKLTVSVAGHAKTAWLRGLVPGPHLIGARPAWPGQGVLVVRPAAGDGPVHVIPLADLTAA